MAHRGRSFRSDPSGRRRKTTWSQGPGGIIAQITAAGAGTFATGVASVTSDLTLVRIRGHVELLVGSSADFGGWDEIGIGICNVSENAAGIGVTAIPTPLADIAWDGWIWHYTTPFHVDDVSLVGTPQRMIIPIDNKAMRKVHLTDVLVGVIETGTEVFTSTLDATMTTRVLDKLP